MLFNIWVTRGCNLRCRYCYIPEYSTNMNIEMANQVIEFIKNNVLRSKNFEDELIINFHGGEPLINKEIVFYIIKKAKQNFQGYKLNFGMTTNGYFLTKSISKQIYNLFNFNLSVSIDGDRETHDLYRRTIENEGTFETIIPNINYLLKLNENIRARMTFDTKTVNRLFENIKFIYELGFKNIVAVPNLFDAAWTEAHVDIFEEEIEKVFEVFINNKRVSINFIDDKLNKTKRLCKGGRTSINIDYNGDIYPCTWSVAHDDFRIGNVKTGLNIDALKIIMNSRKIKNEHCNSCGINNCCNAARCFIINKIVSNDYNLPSSWSCRQNNVLYNEQRKWKLI